MRKATYKKVIQILVQVIPDRQLKKLLEGIKDEQNDKTKILRKAILKYFKNKK